VVDEETLGMSDPTTRRWTREEYDRLIELGVLHEDEPLELVGGEMVLREPQGSYHVTSVLLCADALRRVFGAGWQVRMQMPVALDDESEPEPDVAVVGGAIRDYEDAHPRRPVLVVEVSDASLAFDRERKAGLYARAGVSDYWIVNLVEGRLEVYRDPVPAPGAPFGWQYRSVTHLGPADRVAPLAAPGTTIAVRDLLPRSRPR
jgi:Uma2 family endonuclease